jgi:hypothetical protein
MLKIAIELIIYFASELLGGKKGGMFEYHP